MTGTVADTASYESLFSPLPAPEELSRRAKTAGWPDGLVSRFLTLRFGERWVDQVITDNVPLERLEIMAAEKERLSGGTLRVRQATRADTAVLSELYLASPEQIGEWEVTVDRSPNPFAQFDLQENASLVILEDRSVPLATFSVASKCTYVGGERINAQLVGAWRTRAEARGLGYSALIRSNWGVPLSLPFSPAQYWYIRSQNNAAVNWMNALDSGLLSTSRQRQDDVPGIPATVHEFSPALMDGSAQGIRPGEPDDLERCVALINRTHRRLDLFRPYTVEFLDHKLNEGFWGERPPWWSRNYGFGDFFVLEQDGVIVACAGLWDRGRDVREIWRHPATDQQLVRSLTNVLDLGVARGREPEVARLLRFLASRTLELERTAMAVPLQFLPRVVRALSDLSPVADTRGLAWLMSGPNGPLNPPRVEPMRPYTDLACW